MAEKEYIEIQNLKDDISSLNVTVGGKSIFNDDAKSSVLSIIDLQPTADVQEVVRCKDCIFGKYDDDLNMILCKRIYNLSDGECVYNDLNDFCSCGEKKNKE